MTEQDVMMLLIGIAGALLAGAGLGTFYLWGLWYTVRRQATAANPSLWLLVSMLGRLGLLLGGFYLVGAGSWQRLLACVAGFAVARAAMTRRLGPRGAPATKSTPGRGSAP